MAQRHVDLSLRLVGPCREGNLKRVKAYTEGIDPEMLSDELGKRWGVFGYTPLHEAVSGGRPEVVRYLLEKAGNRNINCRSVGGGYTPLHLAASMGNIEIVRLLVEHEADIKCKEDYGKTPRQTAAISAKNAVVKFLHGEEVIWEVVNNGNNLNQLLKGTRAGSFEDGCLNRALRAAVKNNHHVNVAKIVLKGATDILDCLKYAKTEEKPHARAMLLLIIAAQTGNIAIVQKLFGEPAPGLQNQEEYEDDGFLEAKEAVVSKSISTVVPIEIARRHGHSQVRTDLILRTDVNRDEGYVYWHGLRLRHLDTAWLSKISWVKKLRLERNDFISLPFDIGAYLKQVVKLSLQRNLLSTIPHSLMELPNLEWLDLSYNKLTELPRLGEWPPSLSFLDLSNNKLRDLPHTVAPAISSLNLSNNEFSSVPLCVCSFTTLQKLDLSDNPRILTLPAEMGRLSTLSKLNLDGLKDLSDPPSHLLTDCRGCIDYLKSKLHNAKCFYHMKLMLVGHANRGKTMLAARLQGKEYEEEVTVGVNINKWFFSPFTFYVWDFSGHEDYYPTHQCFLSENALYLLLFNLKHGDKGVEELQPWLNNIALRTPHSRVIIIGTHLDEVPDEERGEINALLHRVSKVAELYANKLQIMEIIPVSLKNHLENIGLLKKSIHNHATNYKNQAGQMIMGQKIPASIFVLNTQLETLQKEIRQGVHEPTMHKEEFRSMVYAMNLAAVQSDKELRTATLLLSKVGSLLHYSNCKNSLHELYFVDPQWLCDLMSKIVTVKQLNPYVKNGIMHAKDVPNVFKDDQFPWEYFEQYLTLLDRFDVALPLDDHRVLVPSMLPDKRPNDHEDENTELAYTRYIVFRSGNTPPGFWSHLLSRIMHCVPKVQQALHNSPSAAEQASRQGEIKSFSQHPTSKDESKTKDSEVICSPDMSLQDITSDNPETEGETPASNDERLTFNSLSIHQAYYSTQEFPPSYSKSPATDSFDSKEILLDYWHTGLYYKDPEVSLRIESLSNSGYCREEVRDGVVIVASPTTLGKKIVCQLVDLVMSVVKEWFPGLKQGKFGLEQKVVCCECMKQGRKIPFKFDIEQCLRLISKNETRVECGYMNNDTTNNHMMLIADVFPDLLLRDIDPDLILDSKCITFEENDGSLISQGRYAKVYRGKCKGKNVSISKYLSFSEEAFGEFRLEAKLFQQSHHPCLVSVIGACLNPFMAIVSEEPPHQNIDLVFVKKKTVVHRLTIFRIAAEVAAALRFLHHQGITYRDLKAIDVLLWTLNPDSLLHCKLASFGTAAHRYPPHRNTKDSIAPEVLHTGKRKKCSVYDHRADVFSFGMFLYEIITRRYPYHDDPLHRNVFDIKYDERPKLEDAQISQTGYHYLTQVMKACWNNNPKNRPDIETIIKKVSSAPTQMVMCVTPVCSTRSLRRAVAITPSNLCLIGHSNRGQSELWVCCDGTEGAEVSMFNIHTMNKVNRMFIEDNQVQCMELCRDYVWVGSRAGIGYGNIDIFSICSRQLVHKIQIKEMSVSCIAATDKVVYVGTLEGYCFSFVNDIKQLQDSSMQKPVSKYISEYPVDGIVCTQQCIWVAHTRYISYLNLDDLTIQGCIHREREQEAFVGQLSFDSNTNIIWSAHLGGVIVSAWDAQNKCLLYDINTGKHLKSITSDTEDHDLVITAMTPVLDTVWVGMASGHIMVLHEDELLCWFHPYKGYVRFLTCISSSGPCEMEKAIVASGGKDFLSLVEDLDHESDTADQSGTVILWEAYEARTMRQVKLIEENSPTHLDNHESVCKMIERGGFSDGTGELIMDSSTPLNSDHTTSGAISTENMEARMNSTGSYNDDLQNESSTEKSVDDSDLSQYIPEVIIPNCAVAVMGMIESFDVKLPDSDQVLSIRSPKPAKLSVLLREVQAVVGWDTCRLQFQSGQKTYRLQTQEHLEQYLKISNKPPLDVVKAQRVALSSDLATNKDKVTKLDNKT